tara:strand:- start:3173 stop:4213 length:1041 start_codon:yes stop_codon:yes gene_type:complete
MENIIIFKIDRVGDLIHLSGCIKAIHENFRGSQITLVCSKSNYQIAKNYSFIRNFIVIDKEGSLRILIKYFNLLILNKYSHLFLLDGKNKSLFLSYFIRSKIKSSLCYWKVKKIFGIKYNIYRPYTFILNRFIKNYVISDENYYNTSIKYQDLYFKLLENIEIKVNSKKNYYVLNDEYKSVYKNFFNKYINENFCIFHFDERWDKYRDIDFKNSLKIISRLSSKNKVLITTGIKPFKFLNELENLYCCFDYNKIDKNLIKINYMETNKVIILKNLPLDLLSFFIANSINNISSHSGPILNISTAFDINVVDIIKQSKFNELGRWIPLVSKYKRYSFEDLINNLDDF